MIARALLVLLIGASSPIPLRAQTPPARADSATERYHRQVVAIWDTLTVTRSTIQSFRRDLSSVGAATVIGRARRASQRCEATRRYLERAGTNLRAIPPPSARVRDAVREYVATLEELDGLLLQHCAQGLAPTGPGERADTLRAWGAFRVSRLERAFTRQTEAAHRLARAADFRIEPRMPGQ